jgi:hypothetical protein
LNFNFDLSGTVAEGLGSALQKLLQQFESVRYLRTRLLKEAGFFIMLTQEDENFIRYWSEQRQRKKQFLRKISIGSPLGVFMVLAIMISLFAGWYQKADMVLHEYSSLIIVILIAGFGIVAFITIFSAQHKWDQNELHYQELLRKKETENSAQQLNK